MGLFSFFQKDASSYFSESERQAIVEAIRQAELQTSGEVRLFIEHRCRFVNPVDRAAEVFYLLKMDQTVSHNAVLVYLAMKDRQFALFADEGIYQASGKDYWHEQAQKILEEFSKEKYAPGLVTVISNIGQALKDHFPFDESTDKNELPDEIVFGRK